MSFPIIADVARNDRQPVMKSRRRNDEIGLREGVADFAAILDQKTPFEHDVFGDRQYPLLEHRPNPVRQPVIELCAAIGVCDKFNTEADFGEGHSTHIEEFKRLSCHESKNFAFWLGSAQFKKYVRVE